MSLPYEALYTLRLHENSHLITECESSWWVIGSYKPNYFDIKIKTRLSMFKWLENGPLTAYKFVWIYPNTRQGEEYKSTEAKEKK